MGNSIFAQAANFIHERRGNRRWRAVVICLAVIVAGATAWGLSKKGQALTHADDVLDCQLVVHEHSEECYDENGNLICGIADYVFHEHDESCYDADEELVCQLPEVTEHVHTDDCFTFEEILICTEEETPAAENGGNPETDALDESNVVNIDNAANAVAVDTVYTASAADAATGGIELICGREEHTHSAECYEIVTMPSGEEEVIETLTCTQDVHTHDDSCFDEEGNLICTEEEHSHNADCYEYEAVPSGEEETIEILICTQEEHTHSAECYSTDAAADIEDTDIEDTDIVDSDITDSDTTEPDTAEPNPEAAHVHTDACYMTVRKLICAEKAAHIHDESCYDKNGNPVCGAPYVESVETHVHDEECFKPGDDDDTDYTKSFSNDDIVVTAVYKKSANIPVEAKLNVEQIIVEESNLDEYKQRLETVLETDETPAMLLNLRFSTDDELFVPEDTVNLTVEFKNDNIYAEGDTAKVASVTENGAETIINANIDDTHSVTFDVDGLTDFAFIAYEENDVHALTYEGEDYIVTVALGEETTVPEDAELVVEQITLENNPEAYEACLARLEEAEGVLDENEMAALLLNIGIYAEGNEIVPDETMEVSVQFLNREIYFEGDAVKAAHFTNDSTELLAASAIDENVSTTFTVNVLAGFAFITDAEIRTLTSAGEDFIVTVRFSTAAMIPEDAQLVARRITEESDPEEFTNREDQLQDEITDELIALGALFDISFYGADGMEIEPQDVVDVKIQLLDKKDVEEADSVKVAHFVEDEESAEESIEIIEDADVSKDGEGSLSTTFQTESFSTFAVTVEGKVDSASTLRKAIYLAQGNKDGGIAGITGNVTLQGDIVFARNKDEIDDPYDGALQIYSGCTVNLNLNGYTIKVVDDVTLFDIRGALNISDNLEGDRATDVDRSEEPKLIGVSQKSDTENYKPQINYNEDTNHLDSIKFYITDSTVVDSSVGATREDLYEYTITGHGAIIGSMSNVNSPLLYMPGTSTLGIGEGVVVAGNGNRAVELRDTGNEIGEGTLNLSGCYLVDNVANRGKFEGNGGAIYAQNGVINIVAPVDGKLPTIIADNNAYRGGGIYAQDVIINMNGGYITNNVTTFNDSGYNYGAGGGGMFLEGAAVYMKGGYITGNITNSGGGGIALGGSKKDQKWINQINTGTISSNYCIGKHGEGGGIALYDESIIEINSMPDGKNLLGKVFITNNQVFGGADWGGGGLFVGQNASATLFDTLITDNSAEGFGGGLGGCSTGRIVEVNNTTRGAAIFDNSAEGQTYAGASTKNEDHVYSHNTPEFWERDDRGRYYFQDLFSVLYIALENDMLGGGSEHWDGTVDGVRVNANENFWQASYICGLTAFPSENDKNSAKQFAHVYINGNHSAVHGGGIMCNGIMIIGENAGEIEIITAMELTGTKKLIDGNGDIPLKADQAGQFNFTIYSGNAYNGQHTHENGCHVGNDPTKPLICGLEQGEPVFDKHEHKYLPPLANGDENPDSCYRELTDTAGGKKYELICDKGVVATGTNGVESTNFNPNIISFDSLLTFDLQSALGAEKSSDISEGETYTYVYYIQEDEATEASGNVEIARDRTVYRLEITVVKRYLDNVGISPIKKYYDDVKEVKIYRTNYDFTKKEWSWSDKPVATEGLMHNQFHAVKLDLDKAGANNAAFTNKKTDVKRIEVRKSWDYDYGLEEGWNKEDEVYWVSVAIFEKGKYGYNDQRITDGDHAGETTTWDGEITKWGDKELDRLYLSKENNWTASWEGLPADFPIADIEIREVDIKYTDVKWQHWYMSDEAIKELELDSDPAKRIEPAVWTFLPKYTYTSEGDVAKVVALNIPKTFGISFTKIGYNGADDKPVGNGKNGAIYGAMFEVYNWVEDGDNSHWAEEPMLFEQVNDGYSYIDKGVVTNRRTVTQLTTNIDGKLNISNLWYGRFLLKEVAAPVGYKPVHDHIIDYNGATATEKVSCMINGKEVVNQSWTDPETGVVTKGTEKVCDVFAKFPEGTQKNIDKDNGSQYFDYDNDVLIFTMIDPEDKYELPESGGPGTTNISILGAVLLFGIATLMYTTYRRRREGLRR